MFELTVSDEEWERAQKYFDANPNEFKFKKSKKREEHSFITIDSKFYVLANRFYAGENKKGRLGKGGYGKVKIAQSRDGENYSLKIYEKPIDMENALEVMKSQNILEAEGMRRTLRFSQHGRKETSEKHYILSKYIEGDSLLHYINNPEGISKNPLTPIEKSTIALKICYLLQELHNDRIIHGDLKPDNIIVKIEGPNISVSFIDYDFSFQLDIGQRTERQEARGTEGYMAPELNAYISPFGYASDLYAAGQIFKMDFKFNDPSIFEDLIRKLPQDRPLYLYNTMLKIASQLESLANSAELDPSVAEIIEYAKIHKPHQDFLGSLAIASSTKKMADIIESCQDEIVLSQFAEKGINKLEFAAALRAFDLNVLAPSLSAPDVRYALDSWCMDNKLFITLDIYEPISNYLYREGDLAVARARAIVDFERSFSTSSTFFQLYDALKGADDELKILSSDKKELKRDNILQFIKLCMENKTIIGGKTILEALATDPTSKEMNKLFMKFHITRTLGIRNKIIEVAKEEFEKANSERRRPRPK